MPVSKSEVQAKYYPMTHAGRKQLQEETESWGTHVRHDQPRAEDGLGYA